MSFEFETFYRFWFLIILTFFSVLCILFVLYYLLFDRTLRRSLHNHAIIILLFLNLFTQLTDIPFVLHFFQVGYTWQFTVSFSHFWTFIDYGCYTTRLILFAWMTIERHILIFHDRWLATKKKRFFLHYLPILIILIYSFFYYLTVIVILSCEYPNIQSPFNGVPTPCLYNNAFIIVVDLLLHQIIPTITIVIFSIALLVRVLLQKSRLRQAIQWRKQRKMTVQLLSIAVLFQLLNFPWAFIIFCEMINLPIDPDYEAFHVLFFFRYYLVSFLPFVCCGTLPKLREKLKKLLFWQRQTGTIHPTTIPLNPTQFNQTLVKPALTFINN